MAEALEIGSHGLTAILATWLGVTVVTRARGLHASRVFAWLTLLLAAWSTAIVVERLTNDPTVGRVFNDVEDIAAFLLPAATLHIVLVFTVEGWPSRLERGALVATYAVCALAALQAVLDPAHPIAVDPPHLTLGAISGAALGWAWIAARIGIFLLAIWWSYRAFAGAQADRARRGQTGAGLATGGVATVGGSLRRLPQAYGGPKWIGVSLVAVAILMATYAVLSQGVFLAPRAARQAYRYSLLGGLAVVIYVGLLFGAETVVQRLLHVDLPIFTALVVVGTIGLFEPIRERLSRVAAPSGSSDEAAYRQLERALDPNALASQPPEVSIQPAIERVARLLGLSGAVVADPEGTVVARSGTEPTNDAARALPLLFGGRLLGNALFGPKRTGAPYTPAEAALLDDTAGYIAASIDLGERQVRQAAELQALGSQRAAVADRASQLNAALERSTPAIALRINALGPLRVERDGSEVRQWGGPKAGSRQAEAVFAFLFDRGDRGVSKDEMTEVIWPDVDLEHADLAFHRTLVGLRGLLEPDRVPRGHSVAISFHNDRYRLDPRLIAWSDVAEFGAKLAAASSSDDPAEALRHLEGARLLYRGDYLDDCPFYGDSEYVEERRGLLRGRYVDLLVTLGERHEARGDRPASAAAFREALVASGGACPPAEAGLGRLGATA
jgi:DNA-binding SARP family transcriptional activator